MKQGILFVLSGPSGSGKTTLAKHIVNTLNNVDFAISYTTRKIREGEKDGIDYKFISENEFSKMVKSNQFAEWAEVHGNLYGTPIIEIVEVLNKGLDILLDIDVQGSSQIKKKYKNSVHIFLIPPDIKILRKRLGKRNTENSAELEKRMDMAIKEISKIKDYDYIVVSDDIENSLRKLESIIVSVRSKTIYITDYIFGLYNITNDMS
jgi:guanylate kinase